MNSINVLDVTLRDGGCVNDFNFGQEYMDKILTSLEKTGVEYIELGYIDEKKGTAQGRTQYCNEKVIQKYFLKNKKQGINYVAMMDYGKFNIDNLQPRTEESIDGIRMAFHKKNWKDMIPLGRKIIDKGYKLYIQPMLTMRYSDMELLELIMAINEYLPDASGFYIVDSFGEMRGTDVIRLMHLVDNNLNKSMKLGFHSHNNLQLSYSNAMELLSFSTNRNLMIDSSVMGMGKGAGNLNTELLLEHLNLYYGKSYKVAPLLELIDQVINVLHSEMYWGYAVEYYLSSINRCTPSYAGHFYNKHMLRIDQVADLLSMIEEDKKVSFDKEYAEQLYLSYNAEKRFDDTEATQKLLSVLKDKKIVVIAPGKSINVNQSRIQKYLDENNTISISLNNFKFDTTYVLTTRSEAYEEAVGLKKKIIVPSNIIKQNDKNIFVIDYRKWITVRNKTYDSSGVIVLNLLRKMDLSEIILAGFDGFSVNINENYSDPSLRHPVTEDQAEERNKFYKQYIAEIGKFVPIRFITKSVYNENVE